jgi:hypothetical protein
MKLSPYGQSMKPQAAIAQPNQRGCSVTRKLGTHHLAKVTVTSIQLMLLAACSGGGGSSTPVTTYTVGGIVSGISGSGLVLQNNGGPGLMVSASGAFIFPGRIALLIREEARMSDGSMLVKSLLNPED